jgi:hypothetical protein
VQSGGLPARCHCHSGYARCVPAPGLHRHLLNHTSTHPEHTCAKVTFMICKHPEGDCLGTPQSRVRALTRLEQALLVRGYDSLARWHTRRGLSFEERRLHPSSFFARSALRLLGCWGSISRGKAFDESRSRQRRIRLPVPILLRSCRLRCKVCTPNKQVCLRRPLCSIKTKMC